MKNYKTNRLIHEKSPYLLQHAYNPVDWYPWGKEAFDAAKREDKPIFLSIGYATCHFCHLMEQESFQSSEIGKMMNETFINVKVDREELPEVDSLYMEFAIKLMPGATGWPLNLVLTPDLQPFFAVTYLPPQETRGLMGLKELISRIKYMWNSEEREALLKEAENIVLFVKKNIEVKGSQIPEKEVVDQSAEILFKMADQVYGGIKGSPKFPIGYHLNFMLRYFLTSKDSRAGFLVERSLDMMHRGGIYDHLGGGFSRYSIDAEWLIPHFEKMLYDNAILAFAYLEFWQMRKKESDKEICREILDYILREMSSNEGGFYSAHDADSEKSEGKFYTWGLKEFQNILGVEESELIGDYFGVTSNGNFYGKNVLHTPLNLEEFAATKSLDFESLKIQFQKQKNLLLNVRKQREEPAKDDKILSSWNALMIYSLVEAGVAFQENRYIEAALNAAHFIEKKMWKEGQLFRRFREGDLRFKASLDEYADVIRAYLTLFEANLGIIWLEKALKIVALLEERFKLEGGGYYQSDGSDPYLILRKCRFSDGAEPSGNAIHTENLLRLYQLTSDVKFLEKAEDVFCAVKNQLENYPPGYVYHLMNLNRFFDKHAPTFVIALNDSKSFESELKQAIYSKFIPHKALIWKNLEEEEKLVSLIPFVKEFIPIDKKTTLYICFEGKCEKPITEISQMLQVIGKF